MSASELEEYHKNKGGYVLKEDEFSKYKGYLQVLAAE